MNKASRIIRVAAALGLVLTLALLAACATDPASEDSEPVEPTGGTTAAEPPTVTLVAPTEGAAVPAGTVEVTVETTGLKFVMPSNNNVAGEGHVHFTLDDRPFEMSIEKSFEFEDVEPGTHTLEAELVQNDTDSFDPPVKQTIQFTVE